MRDQLAVNYNSIIYLVTPQCTHVLQEYEIDKYTNLGYLDNNEFYKMAAQFYRDYFADKGEPADKFLLPSNCFFHYFNPATQMHDFGFLIPSQVREIQYFNGFITNFYKLLFPRLAIFLRVNKFNLGKDIRFKVNHKKTYISYLDINSNIAKNTVLKFLPMNNVHTKNDEVVGTICWGDAAFDYQKKGITTLPEYALGLIEHFFNQPFNCELGPWHLGFKDLIKHIEEQKILLKNEDISKITIPSQIMAQEKFYTTWAKCNNENEVIKFLDGYCSKTIFMNDLLSNPSFMGE